ncbi:MAG: S1 family peptidase [Gemmobacter sp.]
MMWALALKAIYSALLCSAVLFLLRELYIVWLDETVYIGKFDVVTSDADDTGTSDLFARKIVTSQAVIALQLQSYQQVTDPDSPTDGTYALFEDQNLSLALNALGGVEITVQNVNLTAIFSTLRKGFSSPNEVRGSVTSTPGSTIAAVDWPRAPKPLGSQSEHVRHFFVPSQPSLDAAANYIACTISWLRGSAQSEKFAAFPRDHFCEFASALNVLYVLSEKSHLADGLAEEEVSLIRRKIAILARQRNTAVTFRDIYRLRADLIDLLPDAARRPGDLVDAQEDRLSYALGNPRIAKLPEEERRFAALALARPAIRLEDGAPPKPPGNWESLLSKYQDNVRRTATSTGLILAKGGQPSPYSIDDRHPVGTAFMVAPNLAITAAHVLTAARRSGKAGELADIVLCFADEVADCQETFAVTKVYFEGTTPNEDIALVEVDGHSPVFHPPLVLAEPSPLQNTLVGAYAYVVGYPFPDGRMPQPFLSFLLGEPAPKAKPAAPGTPQATPAPAPVIRGGVRRLMPGRLLAYSQPKRSFTSDISTSGGTSGAPLTDFASGEVLGVSFAGMWQGERGKFSFSQPIPQEVRRMIGQRLQEAEITAAPTDPAAQPRQGGLE